VVGLLLERGADPTITNNRRSTPLMAASHRGHLEVVRLLLSHPSAKISIDHRDVDGWTALYWACNFGRGGVVRALLESGANPTIADKDGAIPLSRAKEIPDKRDEAFGVSAEGRRECLATLEVRLCLPLSYFLTASRLLISWLRRGVCCLGLGG
jgi:ankyrin repeat protein